jgi:hypothetical protein
MPKLLRFVLFGVLLASLGASTGCIEFERVISLNKDLSGKAKFRMTMNMEPMARIMAAMEHGMSGKPGDVTEEEVQAAIKKMKDETATKDQKPPTPADIGKLPDGFTVEDIAQKFDGLKMTISVTIGFKDVRKLSTLKMGDPSSTGMSEGADLQPFEGIEIKDEGSTLLITAKLLMNGDSKMMAPKADPAAGAAPPAEGLTDMLKDMMGGMGGPDGLQKQMEAAMKDFGEIFRIETPMAVVDTNATKRESGAVVWQQTLADLQKAAAVGGKPPSTTLSVRLRK